MKNRWEICSQTWPKHGSWRSRSESCFSSRSPLNPHFQSLGCGPLPSMTFTQGQGRKSSLHPSLLHKASNWNETESPLYQSGLPHGTWLSPAVPSSHLAWRLSRSTPQGPVKGTEGSRWCCWQAQQRVTKVWGLQGRPPELAIKWKSQPFFKEIHNPRELR